MYQGLTETCAGLSIQDLDDLRPGIAGVPLPCNEVKLESCPEINDKLGKPYLISDREDHEGNPILGRGKQSNTNCGRYIVFSLYAFSLPSLATSLSIKCRRDSCEREQRCCWILHDARND